MCPLAETGRRLYASGSEAGRTISEHLLVFCMQLAPACPLVTYSQRALLPVIRQGYMNIDERCKLFLFTRLYTPVVAICHLDKLAQLTGMPHQACASSCMLAQMLKMAAFSVAVGTVGEMYHY